MKIMNVKSMLTVSISKGHITVSVHLAMRGMGKTVQVSLHRLIVVTHTSFSNSEIKLFCIF